MTESKDKNMVQQVLRSEITWLLLFGGVLWGFVTTVVLPLQALQIQVADIQVQVKGIDTLAQEVQIISTKQQVDEVILQGLTKK